MQQVDPAYQRLKEYRRPGESDAEFGARLGVTQQAVHRWRKGKGGVSRQALEAAVEEFGISLDELVYGRDPHHHGPSRPDIVRQMKKLLKWIQGEAVEWTPDEISETPTVTPDPSSEDEGAA